VPVLEAREAELMGRGPVIEGTAIKVEDEDGDDDDDMPELRSFAPRR